MNFVNHETRALWLGLPLLILTMLSTAQAQERIDENRTVQANERISINVLRGDITIRGTEETQFRVVGTLDELAEGYALESDGGFTRFEVKMPRRVNTRGGNQAGSQLEIYLPQGAELTFETVNGDVDVAGLTHAADIGSVNGNIVSQELHGRVSLGTVNGQIENQQGGGRLTLSTVNGRIRDTGSTGRVSYETVNGTVTATFEGDEVEASTVNGQLRLILPTAELIELQTVNGEINADVGHQAPRLNAQSVGGNLNFTFADNLSAQLTVQVTAGGAIHNDLSDDEAERPRFGPGRSLQLRRGEGQGSINISAVNGRVRLQ